MGWTTLRLTLIEVLKPSVNFAVTRIGCEFVIALSQNTIELCVCGYGK
jgi:hypothetical protein